MQQEEYSRTIEEKPVKKRTFSEIRDRILFTLKSQMTINQLANISEINWKTVEKHLTFLIGKGMITEVFRSEYVRIFDTTEKGREYVKTLDVDEFGNLKLEAYTEES